MKTLPSATPLTVTNRSNSWQETKILGQVCLSYKVFLLGQTIKVASLFLINFAKNNNKTFDSKNVELGIASFYIEFYSTSLALYDLAFFQQSMTIRILKVSDLK